jgi:FtsP/CotA-like multicopper oxidase with cupredoxin domain
LVSRRSLLSGSAFLGGIGAIRSAIAARHEHGNLNRVVGAVDPDSNGFDPHEILTDWDIGSASTLPDGRTLREYYIVAVDREIQVAPGVYFPAWTYNGRVPGPTIRVNEGDLVRIEFANAGTHPHTIHFHGIHSARMDGVPGKGQIEPGEKFVYEFSAKPFGCHLYHCHSFPLNSPLTKWCAADSV